MMTVMMMEKAGLDCSPPEELQPMHQTLLQKIGTLYRKRRSCIRNKKPLPLLFHKDLNSVRVVASKLAVFWCVNSCRQQSISVFGAVTFIGSKLAFFIGRLQMIQSISVFARESIFCKYCF